ncbi:MAG: hypothetical protein LBJ03_03840 [Holosporales bacterium]|jgi:SAM-dependent methyltransferase|nr:hypothetical protein [Holosporales bacterium]
MMQHRTISTTDPIPEASFDPGSFRDPDGRVVCCQDGQVYRTLSRVAAERMRLVLSSPWFKTFMESGAVCPTSLDTPPPPLSHLFPEYLDSKYILKHERISPIVYPYEWSFEMLKDAALLTLDLMLKCLENGFILKDGSAWNLTVHNGKMCFFDVLSIDCYREGQTWNGYGQFCEEFLCPLMIKSNLGLDFQSFFKGSLRGISGKLAAKMIPMRSIFKPRVFKHIFLRSLFENSKSINSSQIKGHFQMPKSGLISLIKSLKKVILGLRSKAKYSVWLGYDDRNSYRDVDTKAKEDLVSAFLDSNKIKSLIDLGCNTGHYSCDISLGHIKVFACDVDSDCIDVVFKRACPTIVPIVLDLMNPSPSCGWALTERKSIYERLGKQDGFLALALVHHICIANNVPLDYFVQLLKSLASSGVLEWISKEDPMVKALLRNRDDVFQDYSWENFKSVVQKYFKILKTQDINNGTRTLCLLEAV